MDDTQFLEMAKQLAHYCKGQSDCVRCIFDCQANGGCIFQGNNVEYPSDWLIGLEVINNHLDDKK